MALEFYLEHFHREGRPLVLVGQEQGALILYEALKQCTEISADNGFVAAYFLGLPGITEERILKDFEDRKITPARGQYDSNVIVICNTCPEGAGEERKLNTRGCYIINPLNWRKDATPVSAKQNPGSLFYKRTEKTETRRTQVLPAFCGAVADPENGVVILTEVSKDLRVELDERVFRSDVWGVFATSISRNAEDRVREYIFLRRLKEAEKEK